MPKAAGGPPLPASVPAGMLAAAALRSTGAPPVPAAPPSGLPPLTVRPPPAAAPPAHAAPTLLVQSVDSMRGGAAAPPAQEAGGLAGSFAPTVEMQAPTSVLQASVPSTGESDVASWGSSLPGGPLPDGRTATDELQVPSDAPRSALPADEPEIRTHPGSSPTGELPLAYGVVEPCEAELPIEMAEGVIEDTDQSPKMSRASSEDVPWEREEEEEEDSVPKAWDALVSRAAEPVVEPMKGPPSLPADTDPRITVPKGIPEDTQPRVELPLNFLEDTQPRVVLDEKLLREEGRGEEPAAPVRASDVFEAGAASAASRVSTTGKHRPLSPQGPVSGPSPVPVSAVPRAPAPAPLRRDLPTPPAPTAVPPRLSPSPRSIVGPPPTLRPVADPDATNPLEEVVVPSSRDITLRTTVPKRPTRTWVWVLMGLALMLAGAAGGAVIFFLQHPEEHQGPPPPERIPPAQRRNPSPAAPMGKPAPTTPAPTPPEATDPEAAVPARPGAAPILTAAAAPVPAEVAPAAPVPAEEASPEELELPALQTSSAASPRNVKLSVQKEWQQSRKLYKDLTQTQSCEKLAGLCDRFYAVGKELAEKKGEEDKELLVKLRKLRQDLATRLRKKGAS